jgi:ribosomal protein L40E
MKYCYTCRAYRPKDSTFCTRCGSSFDVKYCRKLHPNPVTAEYCRVCGSSDLSIPHNRPKRKFIILVIVLVVSVSVVGTALTVILRSLVEDDAVASWRIVGIMGLTALAIVAWTFSKAARS